MSTCCACRGPRTGKHHGYCIECYRLYKRKWYQRNRKKEIARCQAYNYKNYEMFLMRLRKYRQSKKWKITYATWKKNNKSKTRIYDANKHSLRRNLIGGKRITLNQWENKKSEFDHVCAYCFRYTTLTMDHAIPLSRGGKHIIKNIVPACVSCNSRKQNKTPKEFREYEIRINDIARNNSGIRQTQGYTFI